MGRSRQEVELVLNNAKTVFVERFGKFEPGAFIAVIEQELWEAKKDLVKTILYRNSHFSCLDGQLALESLAPLLSDALQQLVPSQPVVQPAPSPILTLAKGKRGKKE